MECIKPTKCDYLKMKKEYIFNNNNTINIYNDDCFNLFDKIENNSIDCIITDPPYFIDKLASNWDTDKVKKSQKKAGVIGSLPVGMKFDRKQSYSFQEFFNKLSSEFKRVLKHGGFVLSFSQARLYHRMAVSLEDEGFEVRDMLGWSYSGQAKAFNLNHFIEKRKDLTQEQKSLMKDKMKNRKTPQLRPMIEPIVLAQKKKEGTFLENWINHGVGLIDASQSLDGKFPGNIIHVPKPTKKEKGEYNIHPTVKPVLLMEHLIKLFSRKNATILDPFMGSGSTALGCINSKRNFIGFELSKEYFEIAKKRIDENSCKIKNS